MEHDELLEILDSCIKGSEYGPYEWGFIALRRVAELHKPRVYKKYQSEEIAYIECTECKEGEPIQGSYYPCDTIQAIQGQLSTEIPTN